MSIQQGTRGLGAYSGDFSARDSSGAPVIVLAAGETPEIVFSGDVTEVAIKARRMTLTVAMGGGTFDRNVPRLRIGAACNHVVFTSPCGLAEADWTFDATVAAPVSGAWPYTLKLSGLTRRTGAAPTYFAGWFAGGRVEVNGERRAILNSTNPSAGALDITLDRWFPSSPSAGAAVVLVPGCDRRWETCGAYHGTTNTTGKFNNRVNFGGHPFVPIGNPSLVKLAKSGGGGKK